MDMLGAKKDIEIAMWVFELIVIPFCWLYNLDWFVTMIGPELLILLPS